jgi:phospholipid N-methyltransferase
MNYRLLPLFLYTSVLSAVPFWWQAIRHPGQVGALFQFSHATGNELVRFLKEHHGPKRVLELGPGKGAATEVICQYLTAVDQFDLVEIDPKFCCELQQKFPKSNYPNMCIYCMDVLEFNAAQPYDFVICTIPLTLFEPGALFKLQEKIKTWCKPHGYFSYVEYMFLLHMRTLIAYGAHRALMRQREKVLQNFKNKFLVKTEKIFGNLPPTYVYHLKF